MRSHHKIILGFTISVLLLMAANFLPQTQKISQDYLDRSLDRALVSFAVAKGLNAVISIAQGTEIAATPAGLGVVFTPGEVLDPFNDMIERFSWVMLASSISLGIQKIFLTMVGSIYMQIFFALTALLLLFALLRKNLSGFILALKIFLFLAILRFSIPLLALANEALYDAFLSTQYLQATSELQATQESTQAILKEKEEQEQRSWYTKVKEVFSETISSLNLKKQINALKTRLDDSFKDILVLITIFIVQTVVSPLIFFYLLLKMLKMTLSRSVQSVAIITKVEKHFYNQIIKESHESKY